jgi:hypothetical protein
LIPVDDDIVAVGGTKQDGDFLRQQADEAEPMKQPPSTFVIVELENVHDEQKIVALKLAPPPGGQPPSPSVDNSVWPAAYGSLSAAARTGTERALRRPPYEREYWHR